MRPVLLGEDFVTYIDSGDLSDLNRGSRIEESLIEDYGTNEIPIFLRCSKQGMFFKGLLRLYPFKKEGAGGGGKIELSELGMKRLNQGYVGVLINDQRVAVSLEKFS